MPRVTSPEPRRRALDMVRQDGPVPEVASGLGISEWRQPA